MLVDKQTGKNIIVLDDDIAEVGQDEYVAVRGPQDYIWYKNGKLIYGSIEYDIKPNMKRMILGRYGELIILYDTYFHILIQDEIHTIELTNLDKFYVASDINVMLISNMYILKMYFMADNTLYKLYHDGTTYFTKKVKQFDPSITILTYMDGVLKYMKNDKVYIKILKMPFMKRRYKYARIERFNDYKLLIYDNNEIAVIMVQGEVLTNLCPDNNITIDDLESISHDEKYVLIKTQEGCYVHKVGIVTCEHPNMLKNKDIEVAKIPL